MYTHMYLMTRILNVFNQPNHCHHYCQYTSRLLSLPMHSVTWFSFRSKLGCCQPYVYIYIKDVFEWLLVARIFSPYRRHYSFFLRNCLWIGMETYAAGMHAENHITFVIMFKYSSLLTITNVTNLFNTTSNFPRTSKYTWCNEGNVFVVFQVWWK